MGRWPAIADYGFLSDCQSAALVDRDGAIDWCCFGRFDQRPVFARLLDREKGGFFRVGPVAPCSTSRRYLPGTLILETRFEARGGVLVLTDCLPVQHPGGSHGQPRGPSGHELLVRHLRCEAGEVEVELVFAPRFDYGLTTPLVQVLAPDLAVATGGADGLLLHADLGPLHTDCERAVARASLRAGEERTVSRWSGPSRRSCRCDACPQRCFAGRWNRPTPSGTAGPTAASTEGATRKRCSAARWCSRV
ncbi:trehalase-like domain-containing protein [Vulgatibacter sp.]|uniref:trehalase-like domain-containing protein n=1 Tax=Vulgatibacter sp. TaxID=1971226 RepID=UPI0035623D15